MNRIVTALIAMIIIVGCNSDKSSKYPVADLLKYGFAVEVKAPADAEIKADDLGIMKELTIKSGDDYNIQILKSTATSTNIGTAVADQKSMAKSDRYFTKVIEEYDNGFIFEKDIDGNVNYDFRFVKVIGDQEYIYQTGMMGTYTEESVRTMYKSVQ